MKNYHYNLIISPVSEKGKQNLEDIVATVYAKKAFAEVNRLDCSKEDKIEILESLFD